ncbi:helix-turn-helix transcriptional regulator [Candidatus Riflebacteria bacterium]
MVHKEFWSPSDLARHLGRSMATVLKYIKAGHFPSAIKINGRWLIPNSDIQNLLKKGGNGNDECKMKKMEIQND